MAKTKEIKIGNVKIGGDNPIAVQSMTNTDTKDVDATVKQALCLEDVGCEIVRVSVPDIESVKALKQIKKNINIPIVADIHYDYRLAVEAAAFVDKLRINPGNIGSEEKVKKIVEAAKDNSIPIRIGVNLGSLEKDIEKEYGLSAKAMFVSAMKNIRLLEKFDFHDIVVSLKGSNVVKTIEANRLFSDVSDYPIHLGITEAGAGVVKSAVGIGALLAEGVGDTIRVSLSADPVKEVWAGWEILKSLGLRKRGVDVISCPTCARANIDVIELSKKIEEIYKKEKKPLTVAIMGCDVNGPGEAKEADVGIVGGKSFHSLFIKGEKVKELKDKELFDSLKEEIDRVLL